MRASDRQWASLFYPLSGYLIVMTIVSLRLHDHINTDGVAYLRHARYLADGQWTLGVSGYWSPLLPGLIAACLRLGLDSLIAARIVLAAAGATFLMGAWLLLRRLTSPSPGWSMAMMGVLAIDAVAWSLTITPDVLVAGVLLTYAAASLAPDLAERPGAAFRCGLLAGVAYLAKAYALPFFAMHFLFTLAVGRGAAVPLRRAGYAVAAGFLGCAIVAGPWVAIISGKYGHLTVTSAAIYNHALTNPSPSARPQKEDVLIAPGAGRLTVWETPERLSVQDWSPLASRANAAAELRVAWNSIKTFSHCVDILRISGLLLLASPLVAYWLRRDPVETRRLVWGVGTIVIYCAGYLPVLVERRYIMPIVLPIGLFLSVHISRLVWRRWRGGARLRFHAVSQPLAVVLLSSFAYWGPRDAVPALLSGAPPQYRGYGDRLKLSVTSGAMAGNHFRPALFVAYHAGMPYVGNVLASTPAELDRALRANGVRVFVYAEDDEESFKPPGPVPPGGWALLLTRGVRDRGAPRLKVFVRTDVR